MNFENIYPNDLSTDSFSACAYEQHKVKSTVRAVSDGWLEAIHQWFQRSRRNTEKVGMLREADTDWDGKLIHIGRNTKGPRDVWSRKDWGNKQQMAIKRDWTCSVWSQGLGSHSKEELPVGRVRRDVIHSCPWRCLSKGWSLFKELLNKRFPHLLNDLMIDRYSFFPFLTVCDSVAPLTSHSQWLSLQLRV